MSRCSICHRRLPSGGLCPKDRVRAPVAHVEELIGCAPSGYPGATVLGVGGFATTWQVQRDGGPYLALKWGRRDTLAARERFDREALALCRVGGGVSPELLETGVLEQRPYLLLEHIKGETLSKRLEILTEPMGLTEIRELGCSLLRAMEELHTCGLVHRDLKPDNIFVNNKTVRLIDLGLAAEIGDHQTGGTPDYAAPEQTRGAAASPAADVYSFGVLLYEMATLRLPFVGDTGSVEYKHANLRPPPPHRFAGIARELESLILDCLSKDPRRRPRVEDARLRLMAIRTGSSRASTSAGEALPHREEPAVLLVVDLAISAPELSDLVAPCGGLVVTQDGPLIVIAWLSEGSPQPALDARRCADALLDRGASRACLHLARVNLIPLQEGPAFVFASALDDVEAWRLPGTWEGLRSTSAAAELNPPPVLHTDLVGRQDSLDEILALLNDCYADGRPGIITLVAEAGQGKSRLLAELAQEAATQISDLIVISIEASVGELDAGEAIIDKAMDGPVLVIADDICEMDSSLLDALEYVTLPEDDLPIVVLAAATPQIASLRPTWSLRAGESKRVVLEALDPEAASSMVASLLAPAEYVPESAIQRLVSWSERLPGSIVALAGAMHSNGFILESTEGRFQLDTKRLADLPGSPLHAWIAGSQALSMPTEMATLSTLCALLQQPFQEHQLTSVVEALESRWDCADPGVGLFYLTQQGLLVTDAGHFQFASAAIGEALANRVPEDIRAEVHRVALRFWHDDRALVGMDTKRLRAIAFHAGATGDKELAAQAEIALGLEAARYHRPVSAEMHYASATRLLGTSGPARLRWQALHGCGVARYRIDRATQAIDDLEAAAALAEEMGDESAQVTSLLECATALDWAQRFAESSACADRAMLLGGNLLEPQIAARLELAMGRKDWRDTRVADAVSRLENAAESAAAISDFDTRVIALMLLGPALVLRGRLDEAEARFEELIGLCEPADDRLHLCAAYGNRMFLWSARKQPERARDDLRHAMRLAKQVGHPQPERTATYNLAEDLYWSGEADDEAHSLAKRSSELARRFISEPVADDALLVARTALAIGDRDAAEQAVSWVRATDFGGPLSALSQCFLRLVTLVVERADASKWQRLVTEARGLLSGDDFLEIQFWNVHECVRRSEPEHAQRALDECEELLDLHPIWCRRFEDLSASVESLT